jgi:hypothetical protein
VIRQFTSEPDRARREPVGAQIQVLLMRDIAVIPLFPRLNIEVHKTSLENWKTSPGDVSPYFK